MAPKKETVHRLHDQDFHKIRAKCLREGRLFEDSTFPAHQASIFRKVDTMKPTLKIDWLRPGEISDKPVMYANGVSRFDSNQNEVGNCWFIGAVSSFADFRKHSKQVFHQVVPKDQGFNKNYAGIFYFRFWQFGEWVEVVVDDRLPMRNGSLYSLSSSDENEYWSSLLEKAYAKLHGSYEALVGGFGSEALVDFTGAFPAVKLLTPDLNMFPALLKAYEQKALIGIGTPSKKTTTQNNDDDDQTEEDTHNEVTEEGKEEDDIYETAEGQEVEEDSAEDDGLVEEHYYIVTDVKLVPYEFLGETGKAKMLRLRNPWGKTEWNGPGKDESPEWTYLPQEVKDSMNLKVEDDGEFWIPYKNLVSGKFDFLEICRMATDVKKGNDVLTVHGIWTKGSKEDQNISQNPQYVIASASKKKPAKVHIYLMEKHRRHKGLDDQEISLYVCQYKREKSLSEQSDAEGFLKMEIEEEDVIAKQTLFGREVTVTATLEPHKNYVVVPSRQKTHEEREFMLRVVHDQHVTLHSACE